MNNVLNIAFAFIIARMGLACEEKLDGPFLVHDQLHNVLKSLEYQRRSFVGCKSARETDGQSIEIQKLIKRNEVSLSQTLSLNQKTPAGEFDQLTTQLVAQRPNLLVANEVGI